MLPASFTVPTCLILLTLDKNCEGFYRKPYVAGSITTNKLIPPKPKTTQKPRPPVPVGDKGIGPLPKDVKSGGKSNKFNTGWGALFNIWVWLEVTPVTESILKWQFQTTTVPSVLVIEWYTEKYTSNWGRQVRAFDDKADEAQKKRNGLDYTCFSWHKTCVEDNYLRERLLKDAGKMRAIGGGNDGTDSTLIAFIVIAVLIGGGVGAVMYYQRKDAAALAEDAGDVGEAGDVAKEEPEPPAEEEKEAEEAA